MPSKYQSEAAESTEYSISDDMLVIKKVLGKFTTLLCGKCLYFNGIMKLYKAEQSLPVDINESQHFFLL